MAYPAADTSTPTSSTRHDTPSTTASAINGSRQLRAFRKLAASLMAVGADSTSEVVAVFDQARCATLARMVVISRAESVSQCDVLIQAADQARRGNDRAREIAALLACLAHPCAEHEFDLTELWSELAGCYRSQGRLDDAMAAWEEAIAAGYQAVPHPRAEIAELLLDAGRRVEADALYDQLRQECPDDVWLYNSAGWSYADAGDHREALDWLDAGIEIALAGGDPEDILSQLLDFRNSSRAALGWEIRDELAERVEAFERPPGPRASPTEYFGGTPTEARPCPHCGWKPTDDAPAWRTANDALTDLLLGSNRQSQPAAPVTRTKIGRNQPCPCGSGRKYKHCHGR